MIVTNIDARIKEIESLVASNELNLATKRLMDFEEDFSINNRKRKREVITIRSIYNELREDLRLYGKTDEINNRTTKLRNQILEFLDAILEKTQKNHAISNDEIDNLTNKDIQSSKSKNNRQKQLSSGPTQRTEEKKRLEVGREKFVGQKELRTQKMAPLQIVFKGKGIGKTYKNRSIQFTLQPIDLQLQLGEITAVVGENGHGKTTLLKIVAGLLKHSVGMLEYPYLMENGQSDFYTIKQQIAYISQELPRWYGTLSDNLHFSASIHGIQGPKNEEEVNFIISRLSLEKYKQVTWSEISGGYKTRFSLAKALVWKPKILVLDEPLANLDVNTQQIFLQDLRYLANSSSHPMSIIVSSQHLHEIENITDSIIFLKEGKTIYNGSIKNVGNKRTENSYEVDCKLSKEELMDLLEKLEYQSIEDVGNYYIINTPMTVTSKDILTLFINNSIPFNYFRDISHSTRKLFKV